MKTTNDNQNYANKTNRILVIGTGLQAPYGIEEIICTYRNTDAGLKKAEKECEKYYNKPVIVVPN